MILKYLFAMWAAIAPTLGDHLWQSTLFAIAAGLLTLILRGNHARARYWLWLAASLKFLIPFSLLVGLGSHLAWSRSSAEVKAGLYAAVEEASQPFTQPTMSMISRPTLSTASPSLLHLLPVLLAAVWLVGFVVVLSVWYARWRKISAAIRDAVPLREGREVEALRRVESMGGRPKPIEILLLPASMEPGIFGIVRPVLVWPERMSARLEDAHLDAVIAHELWHVRRRDNLAAAIHMVVEAVFWFHPLVWWLGARLVAERERACDEEVLELGCERQVYAESILKICEFCVGSPLACVSGVTGADLKKRIVRIMTDRVARKLDFSRKLLLSAAATTAVLAPIVIGSALATTSRLEAQTEGTTGTAFQSVSIQASQPGSLGITILVGTDSFRTGNFSLRALIAFAFDVESALISGPDTLDAKYNVEAKAPGPFPGSGYQSIDAARSMVRNLLANQFQLQVHRGTQRVSAYVLTTAGASARLRVAQPEETGPIVRLGPTTISGAALRMNDFIDLLSQRLGYPVIDQTGLAQTYDFKLDWKGDASSAAESGDKAQMPPPNPSPAVLASALLTQLGLQLQLQQSPAELLIVDRLESPKDLVAARKPVPMDPKLFDPYVGHYAFPGNMVMSVYRDNEHFWTQLSGQPPVELFPEGQGNFFASVVDAQISFEVDAQGQVSGLVLHQNGQNISAPRTHEATAKQMADALTAKVQQKVATPGTEPALRRLIGELAGGKPDYDRMSPGLAQATRDQLPGLQRALASIGSLVSLKFTGVSPQGLDMYEATFEHGSLVWLISMTSDGKIASAMVRPNS